MSTKKLGVVFLPGITALATGARIGTSLFAPPCVGVAPTKRSRPLSPTLLSVAGVSTAPGTLSLTIRLPTANTDGSPLVEAELIKMRIHYASSPGVSESSPYVEQAPSSYTTFAPGLSGTVYVRVAVQDSHGSWSDLSNELSATVPETPRTEFWAHRLSEDSIFSNNTPNAGWVSWSNVTLYFRGIKYAIANGSTNNRYIYWKLTSPNVFLTSNSVPEIGINDVLIGTNVDGYWHLAIYHPQVSAEFIRVGALQSRNWGPSGGSFLNLDDGTFKLGGSSNPKFSWDGSTLRVEGNVVVTGGNVPYSYVTGGPPPNADNTAVAIGAGIITAGRIELGSSGSVKAGIDGAGTSDSDIRFWAGATYQNRASAPFRVTQGGALVATSATITGGVLGGSGVVTITSTGLDVGPYGSIRGGKTGYGSGTGFFLGYSGGTYRLDIGSSSQYLRWDGSTLYVRGRIVAESGSSISGSFLTDGSVTDAKIANVSADKITAGTIVGSTIRTASSGARVELLATGSYAHHLRCIDSTGTQSITLNFSNLTFWSEGDPIIELYTTGSGHLKLRGPYPSVTPGSSNTGFLGNEVNYWRAVNAKEFIVRGCLGVFDDGVELPDGRRVSDVEALKSIRKADRFTHYGVPMMDYTTLPKAVYRPGHRIDENGNLVQGADGADLSALISIIIGAIKELDARLQAVENASPTIRR